MVSSKDGSKTRLLYVWIFVPVSYLMGQVEDS